MSTTWTIARHMIAEGMRMKLALVLLVLLGLVVLGLPFSISGDSSLTGAVQSFMSYGLGATGLLLGLLTVFLSRSVADELVHRQIYLVMTKPVARWQYILGKWLGVSLLNVVFLACSGATIYGMVHYIRATYPPIDDRYDKAELENEVLVARHALNCALPDFAVPARLEFQRNIEQGLYDNLPAFDPEAERARLTKKYEAKWRVVGPGDVRVFEFSNVLCDRSPGSYVHIRYKADVTDYAPDEIFRALWRVGDPAKGTPVSTIPVRHVIRRFHSVPVPADRVAPDHTLKVVFYNRNPYVGEPQFANVIDFRRSNEVQVLFVVGSFGWNLVRLLILMQCKLMFLAGIAFLMTTVFSFPVACLSSFTVYVLAGMRSFIESALDWTSHDFSTMFTSVKEFLLHVIMYLFDMLQWVVPDFAKYDAVETFVNGRNVSLVWVLQAVLWLVLVKTVIVLGAAVLLFHRREVAEISV